MRHCIADVSTHWNLSFLAWMRLLEIKPYIDILITTLPISNDINSKRDGHQLVEIMLTNNEWELLSGLCGILEEFAEATELLGGSKYVTHSIMNPMLKKLRNE